jgi:hypothetical protein
MSVNEVEITKDKNKYEIKFRIISRRGNEEKGAIRITFLYYLGSGTAIASKAGDFPTRPTAYMV